jgi:PAS domain S-box-containing protein
MKRTHPIVWHLVVLALGAATPFAALVGYLAFEFIAHETSHTTQIVERYARATADEAVRTIDRARLVLGELAKRPAVAALDGDRCDALLGEVLRLNPQYANVFTLDSSGQRVCSAARPLADVPARDPRSYPDALTARKSFLVGEPTRDLLTGKWVVSALQPIVSKEGRVLGVVGIALDLVALSSIVHQSGLAPGTVVEILDPQGIIVTSYPDAEDKTGRTASLARAGGAALAGTAGTVRATGTPGIDRLWAFAPVRGTDWIVASGIPVVEALAPVHHATTWVVALAALGVAFVILLSMAIARPISRPIAAIAAAARRMSSGNSVERLAPCGPAEIAALADDLNRMVARRIAADAGLRDSEARLNEAQRNAHIGSWRHLPDGTLTWSDQMYALFKQPRHVPPTDARVTAVMPAEDRMRTNAIFEQAVTSGAANFEFEHRVLWPEGEVRTVHAIGRIRRDARGRVVETVGTVQDVTERKHASAQLREGRERLEGIVDSAMDAIVTVDSAHRVTLFNPAAERMFRIAAADMIGRSLDALIPDAVRSRHAQDVTAFGKTGSTRRTMGALGMVYGLRSDGERFPLEAAISHVTVGGEKFYTAILRDVTEREHAERGLEHANADLERRVLERTAELQAANHELEAFDYSISHDLRAPLHRIAGFGDALLEGYGERLGPDGRDLARRIQASGESMENLITDLLSLSMVSRGEVIRADVDLSAMARGILESYHRAEPARQVEASIAPGVRAHADPGLMRVVLENLLANAWKFTSHRAVGRIEFGCVAAAGEARFFVRDDGAGFDSVRSGKLFEPFRRLHSQSEFPGTGIGLATVQRIIRRHGGRIWAESAVGEGATFWFTTLPDSA